MNRLLCASIVVVAALGLTRFASATIFNYQAFLDGPSESPVNNSPGTGFTTVDYNDATHMLHIQVSFSGLDGTTTASHIHAPTPVPNAMTAGVATTTPTFAGFPLGVKSGTYDNTLDLTQASSWNPSYVTANGGSLSATETAFVTAIAQDKAYLNIHTSSFGGGEIRGFLVPVPEPATIVLAAAGAVALGLWRRRAK